jgi:acetyl-CoA carboxylase biotin carboxyl carrier protein
MKEDTSPTDRPETPLDAICRNALRLLATARDTPGRLRIEADGNFLEMEWPARTATEITAEPAVAISGVAPVASVPSRSGHNGAGSGFCILAPTVGTFYHAPEPDAASFVQVGDEVDTGRQVGIIEVMKLMTPVVADRSGRVVEFLVPDSTPVEYGQSLIVCAPLFES